MPIFIAGKATRTTRATGTSALTSLIRKHRSTTNGGRSPPFYCTATEADTRVSKEPTFSPRKRPLLLR